MRSIRKGYILAPLLSALWAITIVWCLSVISSFSTGEAFKPNFLLTSLSGLMVGLVCSRIKGYKKNHKLGIFLLLFVALVLLSPITRLTDKYFNNLEFFLNCLFSVTLIISASKILRDIDFYELTRHQFEDYIIKFFTNFGYIFFTAIVAIPFYVMVMTSLKNQSELLLNPLNFSIDFSKGYDLFRSYTELFSDFNFGSYIITSFFVSIFTVMITLLFAIPGAYAVARLRFKGRGIFSSSILLIYMVPLIVLALPIYVGFSLFGLRNSVLGILMIYPVTTIPVALYMLQGYFRTVPTEIEESGLMDGLSRISVILKITLPLSLPSIVSVSLYVFMIAWNEFLLAFMLLDDPSKFTITRGVAMLDSSEVPRQHLMAGSVVATIPVMLMFLLLEKYLRQGLTAGSIKG